LIVEQLQGNYLNKRANNWCWIIPMFVSDNGKLLE